MATLRDGPCTDQFRPLNLRGTVDLGRLTGTRVSRQMATLGAHAPRGAFVAWGLPFKIAKAVVVTDSPVTVKLAGVRAPWLVVLHAADCYALEAQEDGFYRPMLGVGGLGLAVAHYVWVYADGRQERVAIRRRFQIGAMRRHWGENCFEAVPDAKPCPLPSDPAHVFALNLWGRAQTRVGSIEGRPWTNWLWAWANPRPQVPLVALRIEPGEGAVALSAISAGHASSHPLRWQERRKAVLKLPAGVKFEPRLDELGQCRHVQMDMGHIISATPRPIYPDRGWGRTYANQLPQVSPRELLVEYTAHEDARFHIAGGKTVSARQIQPPSRSGRAGAIVQVTPATQRVAIRVVDKATGKDVAVKLHLHGLAGEYLAPVDRHRVINCDWFQDYSADFSHARLHHGTYIGGQATVDLPLGRVYLEVTCGFEIRPVRRILRVAKSTREIRVELERVLPWRQAGWVTADTHVHFLSPATALLEGAAEGVNVVNLLASQWGELVTNAGDFDGRTTHGAIDAGGDGEHLVRVGTENRQQVLGHISLLGYEGQIIAPMATGGPDESALGDPVGCLLTEWARQCRRQGGLVVVPHLPAPRCEQAAAIVEGDVDAVEVTSQGQLYGGISPYSLSDWYRYLNCGYFVAAVAGTDKMSATTAVGTVRTYARIAGDAPFTYESWKAAIRRGETFVTYGPLLDFTVEGRPAGTRINLPATGGTLDVMWRAASVTVPMSRVDLMVNGEIRQSQRVDAQQAAGHWSIKLERSSWLALLVRGHYRDKPEIIAAHSSPVVVEVAGTPFYAAADALTILEQIEGALAYLDTVGTRAQTARYRQMRMVLIAAHRRLHNRMHQEGHYHEHGPAQKHG